MVNTASEEINSPKVYGSIVLALHAENKMWHKLGKNLFHTASVLKELPQWKKAVDEVSLM